jgi:hypothetical protein
METFYYPVVVVENEEELGIVTSYCDEYKIDFQFLDNDLNSFPAQILMFVDKDDFKMFLSSMGEEE